MRSYRPPHPLPAPPPSYNNHLYITETKVLNEREIRGFRLADSLHGIEVAIGQFCDCLNVYENIPRVEIVARSGSRIDELVSFLFIIMGFSKKYTTNKKV